MQITVLGAASCTPEAGRETASFCINGSVLIDTGWNVAGRLVSLGLDPMAIKTVLMTHCHHDHFMGLVSLLFFQGLRTSGSEEKPRLQVYGPPGQVARVVDDVWRLLQTDRYPHLEIPVECADVQDGAQFDLPGLQVSAREALHNVPSLHYRLDSQDGGSAAFSGDTPFSPALVELAAGADLLIHEASHGPASTRDAQAPAHSGAPDAAEVAALAGVKQLGLVHLTQALAQEALAAARKRFAPTFLPEEGQRIELQDAESTSTMQSGGRRGRSPMTGERT